LVATKIKQAASDSRKAIQLVTDRQSPQYAAGYEAPYPAVAAPYPGVAIPYPAVPAPYPDAAIAGTAAYPDVAIPYPAVAGTAMLAVGTAALVIVGFMTVVGTIAVAIGTRGSSSSTVTTSSMTDGCAIGLAGGFFLGVMKGSGMTPHMDKQRQQRQYMRSQNHHGKPNDMSVVVVEVVPVAAAIGTPDGRIPVMAGTALTVWFVWVSRRPRLRPSSSRRRVTAVMVTT